MHLLGGVAGWGFPVMREKDALVTIAVHYAGGEVEEIALRNGARLVILNAEATPFDPLAAAVVPGRLGEVLPALADLV